MKFTTERTAPYIQDNHVWLSARGRNAEFSRVDRKMLAYSRSIGRRTNTKLTIINDSNLFGPETFLHLSCYRVTHQNQKEGMQ